MRQKRQEEFNICLPELITSEEQLEEVLSTPNSGVCEALGGLSGDIMVIGVGGKVGPTLARMAKRAVPEKRVIGVARFSERGLRERLESWGIETIQCDLLDQEQVNALPRVSNIVFMAGKKFGTAGSEPMTWAMNTAVPAYVGNHFKGSRFVAFSTLCVYPFSDTQGPGSTEDTNLTPLGEYSNSCIGRERIWQYFSQLHNSPGRLARLNYAIDLRYGVLHDIARKVLRQEPLDISTPVANVIWQGDSTNHILRCLAHGTTPASAINIGARKPAVVRQVAERFGELFNLTPIFTGTEQSTAWHNDCRQACNLFGDPLVDLDTMIRWNASWMQAGLPTYNKPTHYGERRGAF